MQTVITTNNAYDTILLIDEKGCVVSRWDATKDLVDEYIASGADAENWNVGEWPAGFEPEEQASELRTIAAYGEEYGRDGQMDSRERCDFWGVPYSDLIMEGGE